MFAALVLASAVVGLVLGGKICRLGDISLQGVYWILCSYLIRFAASFMSGRIAFHPALSLTISILCYGTLLIGVLRNLRLPGMWTVLVGSVMNMLVVVLNGGRMPVRLEVLSPESLASEAQKLAASLTHQPLLPGTRLVYLADLFRWNMPFGQVSVFSVGDVALALGASALVLSVMLRGFPPARLDGRIG